MGDQEFRVRRWPLFFSNYWRSMVLIVVPLVFLPIVVGNDSKSNRCLYVVCVMALFWVTEALPLPVTSMLPMFLFPCLGILSTSNAAKAYMNSTILMFIGGLIMALSIEHSQLHQRVALKVISLVGCSHRRLNFGLLIVTMFLSMWISNTACTAMMCPIIGAVLEALAAEGLCELVDESKQKASEEQGMLQSEPPYPSKIAIGYYLGAAYSASIGGIGTLIGTGTNITFKGLYEGRFPAAPQIDFPRWMLYNCFTMLLITLLTWLALQVLYMGLWRPNSSEAKASRLTKEGVTIAEGVIRQRYRDLGPMTVHEKSVALIFILSVILYFTRQPAIFPGWADLLSDVKIGDGTPAMFVAFLYFIFPAKWDWLDFFKKDPDSLPKGPSPALLTWKLTQDKTQWGLMFLLGGGFALSEGGKASGMSANIGHSLKGLEGLHPVLLLFICCLAGIILTNFTSNVAIANIILPILAEMSVTIGIHPLYLMMPCAVGISFAFLLPVGTPPNAIVQSYGNIRIKDMVIGGIAPSIIALGILCASFPTWGVLVYPDTKTFPAWVLTNQTTTI